VRDPGVNFENEKAAADGTNASGTEALSASKPEAPLGGEEAAGAVGGSSVNEAEAAAEGAGAWAAEGGAAEGAAGAAAADKTASGEDKGDGTEGGAAKKPLLKRFVRLLVKTAVIAAVIWALLTFVIGIYPVHGNQMFPMLKDGDLAITVKVGGYISSDVVSYKKDGIRYFARIVASPGSTVLITEDEYKIDGMNPAEEIFYGTKPADGEEIELTLGEDEYFVLNDYRDEPTDSRTFGVIKKSELDGKVAFLFRRRGI